MLDYMGYRGQEVRSLVVFPDVADAIAERRHSLGLPAVKVDELRYGISEVTQVVNLLRADMLAGPEANLHGLLNILRPGYDIVWLITHAEAAGWYLSDGLVNASETTTLIRSSGVFLTVMNTCSSEEVAKAAATELGTAFVCTVKEVPDRQAFITGVLFAQKLASGMDYVSAYQLTAPGQNETYKLYEARVPMNRNQGDRDRTNPIGGIVESSTIQRLNGAIEEIERVVYGSQRLGLPPLREMTNKLTEEMAEVKVLLGQIQATLNQVQANQANRNRLIFGLVTVTVILLALEVFRAIGGGG